jgi:peptidoglycan/xylan/chitin deacetylase (PgdA/CDA1 family)
MIRALLGNTRRYLQNVMESPAVILLYHRVTRLKSDPQLLSVSPEHFHDQVAVLKKKYSLLEIAEFGELIRRRKKMPKKAVILSFDDGYADNCLEALPILESLGSQAVFYITTSNLDTPYELWWDALERIFLQGAALPPMIEVQNEGSVLPLPTASEDQRRDSYTRCHWFLKYTRPPERNKIIDILLSKAGLSREGRVSHRLMTTAELVRMGNSASAVIGAHTHNHPVLALLGHDEQAEEIMRSKNILETKLNRVIEHFSYPYGMKRDVNSDSLHICEGSGFRFVCSNHYGQVHSWSNPMQLPRVLVRDWDVRLFEQHLAKFFSY